MLLIVLFYSVYSVSCGSVLPQSPKVVGLKGESLSITFIVQPAADEIVNKLEIKLNGNSVAGVIGKQLVSFGKRFPGSKVDIIGNSYTFTILNLHYKDTGDFTCKVEFKKKSTVETKTARISLTQIKGGPDVTQQLPTFWALDADGPTRYSLQLQGNPRPNLSWEIDGKLFIKILTGVWTIDSKSHIYHFFGFITDIKEDLDGKLMKLIAKGHKTLTHEIQLSVSWGPKHCEGNKNKIIELSSEVYAVEMCGNPAPKPNWTLGEQALGNTNTSDLGNNKYRFSVTLPDRQKSQCGKHLTCKVAGLHGRAITFYKTIYFSFKPDPVKFSVKRIKDGSCIKFNILPQDTGNCMLYRKIKFLGQQNDTLHEYTSTNHSISLCLQNITLAKFVSVQGYSNITNDMFGEITFIAIDIRKGKDESSSTFSIEVLIGIITGTVVAVVVASVCCCLCRKQAGKSAKRSGNEIPLKGNASMCSPEAESVYYSAVIANKDNSTALKDNINQHTYMNGCTDKKADEHYMSLQFDAEKSEYTSLNAPKSHQNIKDQHYEVMPPC